MSDTLYAIILGIVQGITEFLPISSSGHLILVSSFLNGATLPLALNIALHVGTLFAVIGYFYRDWLFLAVHGVFMRSPSSPQARSTIGLLLLSSIPAGVIGFTCKNIIETYFHHPSSVLMPLFLVGIVLWLVDKHSPQEKTMAQLTKTEGFLIGCAQALALIPGVSRSGATISMARKLGMTREAAAKFSFMLGTPAMGGAVLVEYKELILHAANPLFWIGMVTSGLVGAFTIHFLLLSIRRINFVYFAVYRCVLALAIFFVLR